MYQGKTPLDYIADPVTKIRPGSTMKKEPNGYTTVEFQEGVRPWHIIPPVAIWNKGQWYDQLDKKLQDAIHVNQIDEREAFICSGEGTPGDYLLRVYIVPIDVAKNQEPKHPSQWTKKQKEEGDGKKVTGSLYGGWSGGYTTPTTPKKPSPPKPPPLPTGITFRCTGCGHWFDGEQKLSGHSTHCCPGSANWGDEGADWVLACKCCLSYDETAVCKPGFPRPKAEPKKKEEEVVTTA